MNSYHDLHITTATTPRTSIFNLPYGVIVTCTRTAGWEVRNGAGWLLGGEYDPMGLRLDVDGVVIVDSLSEETP